MPVAGETNGIHAPWPFGVHKTMYAQVFSPEAR